MPANAIRSVSRRRLLTFAVVGAGAALAACAPAVAPTAAPTAAPAKPTEAPKPTSAPTSAPTTAAAPSTGAAPAATAAPAAAAPKTATGPVAPDLRIGYQPPYVAVFAMQNQKLLESEFKNDKINIDLRMVVSPNPMYDALAGGSLDLGMGGPPIPQIAGGRPFRVFALIERSPKTHALLVKPDSPVKQIADLKGTKIGTPLGKAYAFPWRALAQGKLGDGDVEILTVDNNEGRSALLTGGIGAWVTWDPFYASVESEKQARVLIDGDPIYPNYVTFFGRQEYLEKYPETVVRLLKNYKKALDWVNGNKTEALGIFADAQKLKPEVAQLTFQRRNYLLSAPNEEFLNDVSDQAKLYLKLGVIKEEPNWKTAVDSTLVKAALGG